MTSKKLTLIVISNGQPVKSEAFNCQPIKTYICIPMEAVKAEYICAVSDDPA